MRLNKYLLATSLLLCSGALTTVVVNNVNPPVIVAHADTKADQSITDIMPNVKLQNLVLFNLKDEGIVSDNAKLSDFDADTFKTALAQLKTLTWKPGSSQPDGYNDLGPYNGGNGAIGPANKGGSYSLEGLQYATSLTDLELSPSLDYAPKYWHADITDISPLASLTNLQTIDLSCNRISDVTPLANLKKVTNLNLQYNCIADFSSLNVAQYSNFAYFRQQVVLPVVKSATSDITIAPPFINKLPQGITYASSNVWGSSTLDSAWGITIDADNNYNQAFYSGGRNSWKNGSLVYTNLAKQVTPGPTTYPWDDGDNTPMIQNPYKYYLCMEYQDNNVNSTYPIFDYYIPYEINVAQYNYQIQPIDKDGNNIPGYTPTTISGGQGDKVTVPDISGYTVNDKQVDSNHQITLPDGNSSSTTIIKVVYDANTVPYKIQPVDKDGNSLGHEVDGKAAAGTKVTVPDIDGYVVNDSQVDSNNQVSIPDGGGTIKVIYTKTFADQTSLNIQYLDNDSHQLLQSKRLFGSINNPYTVTSAYYPDTITINGQSYTLVKSKMPGNLTGTLIANTAPVIFYYQKTVTPPTPNPGPGPTPINPVTPVNPTPTTPTNPGGTTTQPAIPNSAAVKGEAVYSLKKIYLYKNANFKKSERRFGYVKKPRVNRPMFVVTGYKYDRQGKLRYQVKDVNHLSKTDGWKGYITANFNYVRPVYYHSSHKTLTVINPRGVNEYWNKNLTGKVKNFKQGQVLRVKGFVKHNLTTRYQLTNGRYITGNRKLVKMGKVKQPKRIVVKKTINRYQTANLTKRNGFFKKGSKVTIKRYTFSHAASLTKSGTKRFAVKGGYITANSKYVKVYYK